MKRAIFVLAALAASGCASLDVFTIEGEGEAKSEVKVGAPFHDSKPYLLVTRTGAKDGGVESKIVYIADQSVTYYARLNPGIGLNQFTLTLADGRLVSLNQQADTKLPELLANLATPVKGLGEAAVSFANAEMTEQEAKGLQASLANESKSVSLEEGSQLKAFGTTSLVACNPQAPAVADHNPQISDDQARRMVLATYNLLCAYETASPLGKNTIKESIRLLLPVFGRDFPGTNTAVALSLSGKHPTAQALRAIASPLKKFDDSGNETPSEKEKTVESLVKRAGEELAKIADEIDPVQSATPHPTFELYEIILGDAEKMQLRRVEVLPNATLQKTGQETVGRP